MANSFGHFTLWVSVSDILKSEPSCISHKPRASFQRWQVWWGLQHGKCHHAAIQSCMTCNISTFPVGTFSISAMHLHLFYSLCRWIFWIWIFKCFIAFLFVTFDTLFYGSLFMFLCIFIHPNRGSEKWISVQVKTNEISKV